MPGLVVSPILQSGVYAPLVAFISTVTGLAPANIVQGIPNRAAMPSPGFVSFQAVHRHRLRTNLHEPVVGGSPTVMNIEEGVELRIQIDCYGPQSTAEVVGAEDWATMLSTTLRDEFGVDALAPTLAPLHADDATMVPLVAGEDQYEERWMLEAYFQYNPVTTVDQQYAAALAIQLWDVPSQAPY